MCSIFEEDQTIITCPVRFREEWLIAEDAAQFFFDVDASWTSIAEVRLTEKDGNTAGHVPGDISPHDSLVLRGAIALRTVPAPGLNLRYDAVDAGTGQELRTLGQMNVAKGKSGFRRAGTLMGLAGRSIVIRPKLSGMTSLTKDLFAQMKHVYRVRIDSTGSTGESMAKASSAMQEGNALPTEFALHQNYPNPFNPSTQINFDLPEAATVSLVIYDVLGREVTTVAHGMHEAGYHSVVWNAANASSGVGYASGVFFARFNGNGCIGCSEVKQGEQANTH